jgi:hypothetical protein
MPQNDEKRIENVHFSVVADFTRQLIKRRQDIILRGIEFLSRHHMEFPLVSSFYPFRSLLIVLARLAFFGIVL